MFVELKKKYRKIVAAILSVLVLLLFGTVCVIYLASYMEMTNENRRYLKQYVEAYTIPGAPGQDGVSLSAFSSGEPTVGEDFTTTPVTATMTNGSQKEFTVSAKNGADGNGVFAAQIENGDLILYMEQIDEGTFGINPDSGQLFAALGADAADFIGTLRTLRRR